MNELTRESDVTYEDGERQIADSSRPRDNVRSDPQLLGSKLAYTIPEAGLLIGLCRASVYKLIADGQLSTVNLAERAPRILREELQAFLQRKAAAVQARREAVAATLGTSTGRWR